MLNNLHVWVFVKWELKKIKTRSQRMTSSGYLKKIQNQRIAAGFGYFKKTSQNCRVSRKPGKEEPGRFLGGYFTFTIWDLSFRTSTNKLTEEITRYFTGLSLPPPPKTSVTDTETYWINIKMIGVFIIHFENIYNIFYNINFLKKTSGVLYNIQRVPPHSRVAGSRNCSKSLMLWRWPLSLIMREISEDSLT